MKGLQIVLLFVVLGCSVQFSTAGIERRISAFNIQTFGKTKAGKPWVMEDLVQILKRNDIILIQEIRDIDEIAIVDLLDDLNADTGNQYSMIMASRQGRSSSYKEQYCYFYKHAAFEIVASNEYPDNKDDYERAPFNVHFKDLGDGKEFVLSGLHAKPDDAVAELDKMPDVYNYIISSLGVSDVLMLGDFNADCSYVGSNDWSSIALWTDQRFNWLIDNYADTTVSTTDCAYDRFVVAGNLNCYSASVFRFDEELSLSTFDPKDVSDHYPVEVCIS
ncbi:Deoxyribonuclease-1-like 2 [Holothuria leucospilota]|uniref:Deoxyribonuclease n=1 Tax=Holothuria leucospilota TaxID=206669 RepID=A0A9Q1C1U4_HOLLE|nr:Deoxyribonuclease-1-like 2 [Holothuria leucospilota]